MALDFDSPSSCLQSRWRFVLRGNRRAIKFRHKKVFFFAQTINNHRMTSPAQPSFMDGYRRRGTSLANGNQSARQLIKVFFFRYRFGIEK
jgi:hypothetical protein